jgi:autonomous glycyl radical cofactor GrcA
MLNIKNLAEEKELDRAEMEAVTGGNSIFSNSAVNSNAQLGGVSFASPQINVAPVTQVDASQHTDVDLTNVTKSVTAVGSLLNGMKL